MGGSLGLEIPSGASGRGFLRSGRATSYPACTGSLLIEISAD